jgi:hypothetical protein
MQTKKPKHKQVHSQLKFQWEIVNNKRHKKYQQLEDNFWSGSCICTAALDLSE